eukprot:EC825096.1.p1 GENE.EC825096.1~~EC825096.1.p1  ORF type:complete len:219 (+),score=101.81 EC825096.1:38-694(+)
MLKVSNIINYSYKLFSSSQLLNKPLVTSKAPEFTKTAVINKEFKTITLNDLTENGKKYCVLFFYPLDFTFVCPTEIIAFSERIEEFKQRNCNVAAVSCDSEFSHLAWINTPRAKGGIGDVKIPVIADFDKSLSKDYDVLIGDKLALRGLFIISEKGIVRQATINDLPIGRDVDEVLRLVDACQFSDEHGEVCPAGWKKGKKTINPKKSLDYFESENKE